MPKSAILTRVQEYQMAVQAQMYSCFLLLFNSIIRASSMENSIYSAQWSGDLKEAFKKRLMMAETNLGEDEIDAKRKLPLVKCDRLMSVIIKGN